MPSGHVRNLNIDFKAKGYSKYDICLSGKKKKKIENILKLIISCIYKDRPWLSGVGSESVFQSPNPAISSMVFFSRKKSSKPKTFATSLPLVGSAFQ